MQFEWDDEKDRANRIKHGVSFSDATEIFQNIRLTAIDSRRDYGETRKITIGEAHFGVCVVVYTERDDVVRIISARRANERERKKYYEHIEREENE
jgi:uncharacterized DUF497 family protein